MDCPKCMGKLQPTTVRVTWTTKEGVTGARPEDDSLTIDQCFLCHGIWFDKGELVQYLDYGMTSLGGDDDVADPDMDAQPAACPKCGEALAPTKMFRAPDVNLQKCPKCEGVWVDDGELNRLEKGSQPLLKKLTHFFDRFQNPDRHIPRLDD